MLFLTGEKAGALLNIGRGELVDTSRVKNFGSRVCLACLDMFMHVLTSERNAVCLAFLVVQ